jgi:hypothetical protein
MKLKPTMTVIKSGMERTEIAYVGRSDGVFVHHRYRRTFGEELPHQVTNSDL